MTRSPRPLQGDHAAVLAYACPAPSGGEGERQCGLMPVAVAAPGFVGELREVAQIGHRPHLLRGLEPDQLDVDPDAAVHGDVGPKRADVL